MTDQPFRLGRGRVYAAATTTARVTIVPLPGSIKSFDWSMAATESAGITQAGLDRLLEGGTVTVTGTIQIERGDREAWDRLCAWIWGPLRTLRYQAKRKGRPGWRHIRPGRRPGKRP